MSAFLQGLNYVTSFVFEIFSQIMNLYVTLPILIAVFALWILNRIFHIFQKIRGL